MMTNRPSLSLGFWGPVLLAAGMYACSAGDVSSPRTGGSNSNGNGGSSNGNGGGFNGNGGSSNGNGGTGNAPLGNGGGFNGNGGSSGNGGSGNSPLGNGGSSGSGNGGTTSSGGGFGSGGTAAGTGGSAGGFVGAGGTTGTGGTAAGAGGTAGAGGGTPMSVDSVFANAGFGMITAPGGMWQGYLYTATYGTGSITPVCPTPCFTTKQLCVNGNVPMDPTYGSGALLGWNVAQPMTSTVAGTVALAGTGVTLTFAGSVGGFHVSLLDGAATPTEYCYVIPAAAGTTVQIPFASFVTNCSDPSKTMTPIAAGTMIQKMQITVQSTPAMAAPFNFCLVNVAVQ